MIDIALAKKAREHIEQCDHVLLITHEKPDGDAIASLLACADMLKHFSIATVDMVCINPVPHVFQFLPGSSHIRNDFLGGDVSLIITLDCGDLHRTGFSSRLQAHQQRGVPIINVDHHPRNDLHKVASINLVDDQAASTTHVLYQLCRQWDIAMTPKLATTIFTGLYTDTGSFQHSITTPQVLTVAAEMMQQGARMKEIQRNLNQSRTVSMLKLWGTVLGRMRVNSLGVAASVVTQHDLRHTHANEEDVAGIVTLLEAAGNAKIALLLVEQPGGRIKGSMRSNKSGINSAYLARLLGGGGHSRAAGFVIDGTIHVDESGWSVV